MVTHLEGAKPGTVISTLAFTPKSAGNYLITHADRSRDADYKKVQMPNFYAARLQRHFGKAVIKDAKTFDEFFSAYQQAIKSTSLAGQSEFIKNLKHLIQVSNKIETHGGKVIFIRFPTSKLVWEVDNQRYPKEKFWRVIAEQYPRSINFSDYEKLKKFKAPDGSHLDYRDKKEFTASLLKILQMKIFNKK